LKFNKHNHRKSFSINIGNIDIVVSRKNVKYLRMSVSHLDGSVKISSPLKTSNKVIEEFVISRLSWIEKHQKKFQTKVRPPLYKYEFGEFHYFKGELFQLDIRYEEKKPFVLLIEERIILVVRPGSSREKRKKTLDDWYRVYLKDQLPLLIKKWSPIVGDSPLDWGVKNMKTRWGSCNTRDKRIWLSLKLAEKSESCLEYVFVHEMVHLLERGHGKVFKTQMDRVLPEWRSIRDELNNSYFSE
jgi:predicted metal-dependent hydrolase